MVASNTSGDDGPVWRHHVERVFHRVRAFQQQGTLSEIVEGERRHDHVEPGQPDRALAEVAHVGIERLAAGHTQHHGTQNDERGAWLGPHESHGMVRTEGSQNFRMPHDVGDTQHRNRHKPQQGDRPEKLADATGTALLNKEQGKQHQQGDRNDVPLESGGNDFQALDRRQHRDRWRDDAVAIEQ
jgi:hypothetical protein